MGNRYSIFTWSFLNVIFLLPFRSFQSSSSHSFQHHSFQVFYSERLFFPSNCVGRTFIYYSFCTIVHEECKRLVMPHLSILKLISNNIHGFALTHYRFLLLRFTHEYNFLISTLTTYFRLLFRLSQPFPWNDKHQTFEIKWEIFSQLSRWIYHIILDLYLFLFQMNSHCITLCMHMNTIHKWK